MLETPTQNLQFSVFKYNEKADPDKIGKLFFTSYSSSYTDKIELVQHCETVEEAKRLCNQN